MTTNNLAPGSTVGPSIPSPLHSTAATLEFQNDHWKKELQTELDALASGQMLRTLSQTDHQGPFVTLQGRQLVNLSSNDYLGLGEHPDLKHAAIQAIQSAGTGAGASRLVGGHLSFHADAERRFAAFKHAQAALLLPTGYTANLAVLSGLAGPDDLICLDKLNHASLYDAALRSGATCRVFPHLNLHKLERLLKRHRDSRGPRHGMTEPTPPPDRQPRRFIVTDSVFSMDGDVADLPALVALADQYDAILVVDEAHGTGVLGETGAGLCELQGVANQIDVVISTASKALGSIGGIVTADQLIISTLINKSRPFIYSTAIPPAQAATIVAALNLIETHPALRHRLASISSRLRGALGSLGLINASAANPIVPTPIIPILVGSAQAAVDLSRYLQDRGFFAPAIRPPTVAPGSCRVRLSLRADIPDEALDRLIKALSERPVSTE